MRIIVAFGILPLALGSNAAFAQVSLVRNGKACAVVVTAVKPSPVAAYAVEELVAHVKQATGQQLPVVAETAVPSGYASRVFVGVTEAAKKLGIDAEKLPIEEYVLRTVGPDFYIVGKELRPESIGARGRSIRSRGIRWPWSACTVARCWVCMKSSRTIWASAGFGPANWGPMCRDRARSFSRQGIRPSNRGWFIATWAVGTCRRFI